jgi:hypothetical protein
LTLFVLIGSITVGSFEVDLPIGDSFTLQMKDAIAVVELGVQVPPMLPTSSYVKGRSRTMKEFAAGGLSGAYGYFSSLPWQPIGRLNAQVVKLSFSYYLPRSPTVHWIGVV